MLCCTMLCYVVLYLYITAVCAVLSKGRDIQYKLRGAEKIRYYFSYKIGV